MDIFYALSEPRRRDIVEMLAIQGQLSATDISKKFKVTASAISQHLKVLLEAKLVKVEKRAQLRIYQINPAKIHELEKWAKEMTTLWEERYERLDGVLEQEKSKQ